MRSLIAWVIGRFSASAGAPPTVDTDGIPFYDPRDLRPRSSGQVNPVGYSRRIVDMEYDDRTPPVFSGGQVI